MSSLLDQPARSAPVAVVDLEMTGLDVDRDRVIEVAVVRGEGPRLVTEFQSLVRVDAPPISKRAAEVTRITDEMLRDQPMFGRIAAQVAEVMAGAVVVAHNVPYDVGFLHREMDRARRPFPPPVSVDTLLMARRLFAFRKNTLYAVCGDLGVPVDPRHRALSDARATFALYHRMLEILDPEGTVTVGELIELVGALAPNSPLRLRQQKMLRDAWEARRTVVIDYQSTSSPETGLVRREIAIWLMSLPYVQGWCYLRQGERVFRLDRITKVLPGGRSYEVPEFEPRIR